ncbi:Acid phosphatase [Aphelenchoides besseyi]|nr:Acid phosphatase [Aphelenchoides besseyi]
MIDLKLFVFLFSFVSCRRLRVDELKPAKPLDSNADGDLVFVQPLWRHGDRSPLLHLPNDKNKPEDWLSGGGGFGQLSYVGMKQHVELGKKLRVRYDGFISPRYSSNEIYVRSTDVNRTIISAISNMIGFYDTTKNAVPDVDYPSKVDVWPAKYVPIPIHTVDSHSDFVTGCDYDQKHAADVFKKLRRAPDYVKVAKDNEQTINQLKTVTGLKEFELWQIYDIYDTLFIEKVNNVSWPDGMTEQLYKDTDRLADLVDDVECGLNVSDSEGIHFETEIPKITGGPLLSQMISHMKFKRQCLNKKTDRTKEENKLCAFFDPLKYYVFSAHDTTIEAFFLTLGFQDTNWNATGLPHYASCAALELHANGNDYTVKLMYWSESYGPWDITASITGCENGCSLDQFAERSKSYVVDDFPKYCESFANMRVVSTFILLLFIFAQFFTL